MNFEGKPSNASDARHLGSDLGGEGRLQATSCSGNFRQPHAVRDTVLGRASLETGQVHLNEMAISTTDLKAIDKITLLAAARRGTRRSSASS